MRLKEISLFSKSPNNANSPMQFGFPWRKMTSDGTRQIGCHGKKNKEIRQYDVGLGTNAAG